MLIDLVEDYTDYDNGQLDVEALANRLGELKDVREECEDEGQEMDEEEARELKMLVAFKAEVEKATGDGFGFAVLVAEEEFEKHVRYWAEDEHGIGAENLGDYVDWERYARDQRKEFQKLELDGQDVWVK